MMINVPAGEGWFAKTLLPGNNICASRVNPSTGSSEKIRFTFAILHQGIEYSFASQRCRLGRRPRTPHAVLRLLRRISQSATLDAKEYINTGPRREVDLPTDR